MFMKEVEQLQLKDSLTYVVCSIETSRNERRCRIRNHTHDNFSLVASVSFGLFFFIECTITWSFDALMDVSVPFAARLWIPARRNASNNVLVSDSRG